MRADRANDGMTLADTKAVLSDLQPDLSDKQVANYASRTFFSAHKDMLKRPVIAQATTTKRSCCTVEEQFRWFKQYWEEYKAILKCSTILSGWGG